MAAPFARPQKFFNLRFVSTRRISDFMTVRRSFPTNSGALQDKWRRRQTVLMASLGPEQDVSPFTGLPF